LQESLGKPYGIPVYRLSLVRERSLPFEERIRDSSIASRIFQTYLVHVDREHFVTLLLDQKHQVVGIHTVSMGSLTASVVHPREVFKSAILANAAAIICGHNHPSGDPQPSREDRALTTRLVEGGKLLGITVVDHIIIGAEGKYFSFGDEGLLDARGN
jgi:DNA repair protein RadC